MLYVKYSHLLNVIIILHVIICMILISRFKYNMNIENESVSASHFVYTKNRRKYFESKTVVKIEKKHVDKNK